MSDDKTAAVPENELTEEEDMEHETPDSDKSSDDETGTASSEDDAESSSGYYPFSFYVLDMVKYVVFI